MKDRVSSYLRAIDEGETEKYHDYQDVMHFRMNIEAYERKHGPFTGTGGRRKHD